MLATCLLRAFLTLGWLFVVLKNVKQKILLPWYTTRKHFNERIKDKLITATFHGESKSAPAMQAVKKQATLPATKALKITLDTSPFLWGAKEPKVANCTPIEPGLAKPQSA